MATKKIDVGTSEIIIGKYGNSEVDNVMINTPGANTIIESKFITCTSTQDIDLDAKGIITIAGGIVDIHTTTNLLANDSKIITANDFNFDPNTGTLTLNFDI